MRKLYKNMFVIVFMIFLTACAAKEDASQDQFKCEDPIGCVAIKPGKPIKIGVLQTFSGALESNGVDQLRGIQLALDDRGGEILGHPVKLQSEDSHCSGEGGTTAALKITADPQSLAILGTYCSGAAIKAAKIVSDAGLVMISATNTFPALTSLAGSPGENHHKGYFRTAHNDLALGMAVADFARQKLGVNRAATIDDGDAYTKGLARAFSSFFTKLGGQVTLETTVNKADTDMRPVLEAVGQSDPELVFYPIFRPAGDYITQQSIQIKGFHNIHRVTADGLFNDAFLNAVGKTGVGMYFALPEMPEGEAYNAFVERYKNKFKEAPVAGQHAHAFDAANLLFDAIEKAAILKKDQTLIVKRKGLRDALYRTTASEGLTGDLTCDKFGDCGVPRFKIVRLDDPSTDLERLSANIVFKIVPGQ